MRWQLPGLLLFLMTLSGLSLADQQAIPSSWEKIKDQDGISVFTQAVKNSELLKVKTHVVIAAPIHEIQALLDNVAYRKHWIPYLQNSTILDRLSSTENLEYSLFSAPWPASDRDFVYRITQVQQDASQIIYSMISEASPLMPIKDDLVRAELIESTYILTSLANRHTRVELIFHADPKGWLPNWIINIIQKVLPYMILRNLRAELSDPTGTINGISPE